MADLVSNQFGRRVNGCFFILDMNGSLLLRC